MYYGCIAYFFYPLSTLTLSMGDGFYWSIKLFIGRRLNATFTCDAVIDWANKRQDLMLQETKTDREQEHFVLWCFSIWLLNSSMSYYLTTSCYYLNFIIYFPFFPECIRQSSCASKYLKQLLFCLVCMSCRCSLFYCFWLSAAFHLIFLLFFIFTLSAKCTYAWWTGFYDDYCFTFMSL